MEDVHILMIGKGGVGKSSLANAILGSQVCPAAEQPGDTVEHYTTRVVQPNVAVHVYDTRGLLDGEDEIEGIVEAIREACHQYDIIIACIKFNDRFDLSNRMIFDVISKLDSGIWPRMCVALTHSDIIPADWPSTERDERFTTVLQQWKQAIGQYLENFNVKYNTPFISPTSHLQVTSLVAPVQEWLQHFIILMACRSSAINGQACGLQIALGNTKTCRVIEEAVREVTNKNVWTHPHQDIIPDIVAGGFDSFYRRCLELLKPCPNLLVKLACAMLFTMRIVVTRTLSLPFPLSGGVVIGTSIVVATILHSQHYGFGPIRCLVVGVACGAISGLLAGHYFKSGPVGVGVAVGVTSATVLSVALRMWERHRHDFVKAVVMGGVGGVVVGLLSGRYFRSSTIGVGVGIGVAAAITGMFNKRQCISPA